MEIGKKIKELRDKQDLSQEIFAERIGRSRSLVAAWESGRKKPGREALMQIAQAFNISIEYLIDEKNNTISTLAKGPDEVALIELFRNADSHTQQSILHLLTVSKKDKLS